MVHEERFKGRVLQLCIFFIFFLLKVRIPPWGTGRCDSRPGLALSIVERSSFVGWLLLRLLWRKATCTWRSPGPFKRIQHLLFIHFLHCVTHQPKLEIAHLSSPSTLFRWQFVPLNNNYIQSPTSVECIIGGQWWTNLFVRFGGHIFVVKP